MEQLHHLLHLHHHHQLNHHAPVPLIQTLEMSTNLEIFEISFSNFFSNKKTYRCTCCPGPIQPCCSVCCGTWRKRLKVSVAVLLMGLILEEILLGVLLLLFIDSGAGRFFLDSILEERFGACATIGSGMGMRFAKINFQVFDFIFSI